MACPTFDFKNKKILVIGGTQFMGRLVVDHLLGAGAQVSVLNRGRTPSPFSGDSRVRHIRCDRLNDRKQFRKIICQGSQYSDILGSKRKAESVENDAAVVPWDGVIDFVCFQPKNVDDVINCLKTNHYIFISSDSVYMACDPERTAESAKKSGGRLLENDIHDPRDLKLVKSRNQYQYQYGNGKLQCERALLASDHFKQFTILRFPDV
jgi:nucleoside-diphosphate-sugar epimerase